MQRFDTECRLLAEFKGDTYIHGLGVIARAGRLAAPLGRRAVLVRDGFPGAAEFTSRLLSSLESARIEVAAVIDGAAPNAPLEDLRRITAQISDAAPEFAVSFGGGSTIDAVKAALVLRTFPGEIDRFFGTGLVSEALREKGRVLTPHLAIQTAASSGAHLTKYSNITDLGKGQKKLIVDEAMVPARAVFDYETTLGAPSALTVDGALDGLSHALEVLYGAAGKPAWNRVADIARQCISLVMKYLPMVVADPASRTGREALGLATDLGAYLIMIGGTNGAHLTSFSLIDILTHGRACAMLNPYYTVFFGPAIQEPLKLVAAIAAEAGFAGQTAGALRGRELAESVAASLIRFERSVGVPAVLSEVPGFTPAHIARSLEAAKNPQLRMKLENMPVPLTAAMVDEYMGPVLEAAVTGELGTIRNV
jgi:alcohol dehydrogenase